MPKTERLNVRLTPAEDAVLQRAADARGQSKSEYVLRHAIDAAQTDLADRRVFAVDEAVWTELQAVLDRPPAFKPRLARLLSNPSALETTA